MDADETDEQDNLPVNLNKNCLQLNPHHHHHSSKASKDSFSFNYGHLIKHVEPDLDLQLEEHLDRVYNRSNTNEKAKHKHTAGSFKMNERLMNRMNRSKQDANLTGDVHDNSELVHHNNTLANMSSNSFMHKPLMNQSSFEPRGHQYQQHHLYGLTFTSKEVDIDSQSMNQQKKAWASSNRSINYSEASKNAVKHDKVSDWLVSSGMNKNNEEEQDEPRKQQAQLQVNDSKKVKTTVAYYLPGEETAYLSTHNGTNLTLAQFKHLITKKGQFRYFFKTKSDLLGDECVVFQEANDDNSLVPMYNNKVIAKIEHVFNN